MFYDLKIIGQGNIFFDVLKKKKNERKMFYQCSTLFFFPIKQLSTYLLAMMTIASLLSPETATRNCCRGENKLAIVRIQSKYLFY